MTDKRDWIGVMLKEMHMKRNRIMALLLAGCMVIGNGNVLLYAEESDEQLFTIEEDEESEIQEDVMTELVAEGDDLYVADLIEDEEEELYAAETADTTPPVIDVDALNVTLPEGKDAVTVGDTVKVSVKITDDGSGVDYVYFTYTAPQTSNTSDFTAECIDEEGTYEAKITVNDDMPSGVWQIRSIYAGDKKGNLSVNE